MRASLFAVSTALLLGCSPEGFKPTNRGELHLTVVDSDLPLALTNTFDVGAVALGATRVLTVRGVNVGVDELDFVGASLGAQGNGSWFVRSPERVSLAPGAEVTATVTFAPVEKGAQQTQVTFAHDADAPFPSVVLSGSGS